MNTPLTYARNTLALILLSLALFVSAASWAQNNESNRVQIRILPEVGQITSNDEIWIGVEQSIDEHWHTYWRNPGDSGTPPRIIWDMPEGFEIGEIHWPTPKKLPYGPLLNYGYEGNVVLLQKLKTPDTIPEGPITLTADIELLVCKEECIPEYGTHNLTLNGTGAENENNRAYLLNAAQTLPETLKPVAAFESAEGEFMLTFNKWPVENIDPASIKLFPYEWGIVENTAQATATYNDGVLKLSQKIGDRPLEKIEDINGVIVFEDKDENTYSFEFTSKPSQAASITQTLTETTMPSQALTDIGNTGLAKALLLALLGGLILNLMPCVFPVLSIKALSIVKQSEKSRTDIRLHGLAYTAGVMLSFLAIAGLLLALKSAGAQIGWGFQLQNPIIVGTLAYLLFALGLNLIGFFEFANPFANTGNSLTQKSGKTGTFFTGVLATLVATPCTAPFMATALGYALIQPASTSLLIFAALGFGLALPYLALCFIPAFQTLLPKPGAWMDVFKQFLAFPMFAAAVWLVWVISQQSGSFGVLVLLMGATLITFAIWLFKHRPGNKALRIITTALSIIALALSVGTLTMLDTTTPMEMASDHGDSFGEVFSQEKLDKLLAETTDPVFVEMTAAWCITCKVNHATSINVDSTKTLFKNKNVQYLVGDWTNQNPKITEYLDRYGRKGVPIYVFYGAPENGKRPEAQVLPQILTPQIIKDFVTK